MNVAAADVINAMVKLQPAKRDALVAMLREADGDLATFCHLVRLQGCGSLLFDAVVMLRGLPAEVPKHKRTELFEHAIACSSGPSCPHAGCKEIRSMFSALGQHARTCSASDCRTCTHHQNIRDAMRRVQARRAASQTFVAARPVRQGAPGKKLSAGVLDQPVDAKSVATKARDDGCSALLLLARSALVDLPVSSPRNSPHNSPNTSPKPQQRKKPRLVRSVLRAPGHPVLARPVASETASDSSPEV